MLSKTNMRRGAVRVALAGAMVTIPLAAVAATASAEAPAAGTVRVQQGTEGLVLERTDVSRPYPGGRHGHDRPGHDGVNSHESDYYTSPGAGPRVLQEGIPPTT
ncbi:hypothetical protein [Nocardia sp. NPDC050793]|uniref:hypothetical protein n=1 Tax=Nocardia sp. NPDC050793 TaxID=3155159 RepID=UPI0033D5D311